MAFEPEMATRFSLVGAQDLSLCAYLASFGSSSPSPDPATPDFLCAVANAAAAKLDALARAAARGVCLLPMGLLGRRVARMFLQAHLAFLRGSSQNSHPSKGSGNAVRLSALFRQQFSNA